MAKPIKEWGIAKFLKDKAGDIGKEVVDVLAGGENPLKAAVDLVFGEKGSELSEEEKQMALQLALQDYEEWKLMMEDRQNARQMYAKDNQLQKWYGIGFGAAYILVTVFFIWIGWRLAVDQVEVSDFFITLISTLFGAMSAKVNTITDFLFGSSLGSKQKSRQIESQNI